MSTETELGAWARLLLSSLAQAGVAEVVISPGSRCTPLVWAAARNQQLRTCTIIDERSAGFFALGQARITGQPTLLVCTSGTAAANYMPAVVEAAASGIPLLVLTADRPLELQGCAAPQTIDQTRLFGQHARDFIELGIVDSDSTALQALQRKAAQAVLRSRWPTPGAVHLNARARQPLEPQAARPAAVGTTTAMVDRLLADGPPAAPQPSCQPASDLIERMAADCWAAHRGLILCGPALPWQAVDAKTLADTVGETGFVLLCETASQLRFDLPIELGNSVFDGFGAAFCSPVFCRAVAADLVLQLGSPPVSVGWERYLGAHSRVRRHVIAPFDWPDPTSTATSLVIADPTAALRALLQSLKKRGDPPAAVRAARGRWRELLRSANSLTWKAANDRQTTAGHGLCEGDAVRAVVDSLPRGALLVLGNSLPIREVETYCQARTHDTLVCSQRGANGIDGVLSGAAGAASVSGRPTTVLLGDISFLHDVGGLWAARQVRVPLVVVVLNNYGGRIFEQLPVAQMPGMDPATLEYWTTPHHLQLSHAASLFGHDFARVRRIGQLQEAMTQAHARLRCTLIEVELPTVGEQLRTVWERVDRALRPLAADWSDSADLGGAS